MSDNMDDDLEKIAVTLVDSSNSSLDSPLASSVALEAPSVPIEFCYNTRLRSGKSRLARPRFPKPRMTVFQKMDDTADFTVDEPIPAAKKRYFATPLRPSAVNDVTTEVSSMRRKRLSKSVDLGSEKTSRLSVKSASKRISSRKLFPNQNKNDLTPEVREKKRVNRSYKGIASPVLLKSNDIKQRNEDKYFASPSTSSAADVTTSQKKKRLDKSVNWGFEETYVKISHDQNKSNLVTETHERKRFTRSCKDLASPMFVKGNEYEQSNGESTGDLKHKTPNLLNGSSRKSSKWNKSVSFAGDVEIAANGRNKKSEYSRAERKRDDSIKGTLPLKVSTRNKTVEFNADEDQFEKTEFNSQSYVQQSQLFSDTYSFEIHEEEIKRNISRRRTRSSRFTRDTIEVDENNYLNVPAKSITRKRETAELSPINPLNETFEIKLENPLYLTESGEHDLSPRNATGFLKENDKSQFLDVKRRCLSSTPKDDSDDKENEVSEKMNTTFDLPKNVSFVSTKISSSERKTPKSYIYEENVKIEIKEETFSVDVNSKPCVSTNAGVTPRKTRIPKLMQKMPDFKTIHKREFEKMESVVDNHHRRIERAKILSTPKPLKFVPKSTVPVMVFTARPFSPKVQSSKNQMDRKLENRKIQPGTSTNSNQPTRLSAGRVLKREDIKQMVVNKLPLQMKRETKREQTKTAIRGVRLNRRFELQMAHRKMH